MNAAAILYPIGRFTVGNLSQWVMGSLESRAHGGQGYNVRYGTYMTDNEWERVKKEPGMLTFLDSWNTGM
jgi:hypothetical protein